jgi:Domain of unknown function (DUF4149)
MPWQRLSLLVAALWWGGISALSFVAVPTLFASLGSPTVAGPVAAKLFSLQCWAGLLLGTVLTLILRRQRSVLAAQVSPESLAALKGLLITLALVLVALLLAMVQEFGVAQKIVSARASGGNLRVWHGLGTLMVLGQWLCTGAVLWRLAKRP